MLSAGYARIRPVLMTAAAMILGMLPMALGLGEGGEQNAPLGRAVIGGLLGATVDDAVRRADHLFVSAARSRPPTRSGGCAEEEAEEDEELQREHAELAERRRVGQVGRSEQVGGSR